MPDSGHLVIGVGPAGEVRAVYDDRLAGLLPPGTVPVRASSVEPVPSGPLAGQWFADMSPLGPDYRYCLWPPRTKRSDALAAEVAHIERTYILGQRE